MDVECEELKEGSAAGADPSCAARKDQRIVDGQAPTCDEDWLWKEDGCRKDYTSWVGRARTHVEAATKKKARRHTGCTLVSNGGKLETRSQKVWEKLERRAKTSKEDWQWQREIAALSQMGV